MKHQQPIFWPIDITDSGFLYGWTHPMICVAGVLRVESRVEAEACLHDAVSGEAWRIAHQGNVSDPMILGRCVIERGDIRSSSSPDIQFDDGLVSRAESCLLVCYQRFKRASMRFYSLDSRDLDILPYHDIPKPNKPTRVVPDSNATFLQQDFTRTKYESFPSLDSTLLSQLNISRTLEDILVSKSRTRDWNDKNESVSESSTPNPSPAATGKTTNTRISRHSVVDKDLPVSLFYRIRSVLREKSAVVEQFDVRFEQACFVIAESFAVYSNRRVRSADAISTYVKFYNCIWLVLNDIIIGAGLGAFLCENKDYLATVFEGCLQYYMVDCMQDALLWLNNWPAGLKLNTELSQFYCNTLLGIISLWGQILQWAAPYFPAMIWVVGAMGYCGMTMIVSLFSDILRMTTVHLYLSYLLSTLAFSQQSGLAGSLWNLFRGKRFNVLRNRLDSWDYDLDQLLLGTILFTLVAFLYPTVFTYYAFFATIRVMIIMVHATLDTTSALLNHFPLFALMLRFKDPMRLPGRATFRYSPSMKGSLVLKNEPAPLGSIFKHYAHLGSRLWSHYHPLRILRQLMAGQDLRPIPRSSIRYNMVSSQRSSEGVHTNTT